MKVNTWYLELVTVNIKQKFHQHELLFSVTAQRYEINILPESIIVGNDAIFKCSIPSFVSDFVYVETWIDSESNSLHSSFIGIYSKCEGLTDWRC